MNRLEFPIEMPVSRYRMKKLPQADGAKAQNSRQRMQTWSARLRRLAKQTGSPELEQSVEAVLQHLRGELPNWHAGGSIN